VARQDLGDPEVEQLEQSPSGFCSMITLPGLMSRCTTPHACSVASALTSSRMTDVACVHGMGRRRRVLRPFVSSACSVMPSTYSITRYSSGGSATSQLPVIDDLDHAIAVRPVELGRDLHLLHEPLDVDRAGPAAPDAAP
jgi:hypothetical protein